ncbi:MAG: AAA family ATPase [Acetatifactor sp.]|nr:AAA family ATPase [Acetatifactor sp.]
MELDLREEEEFLEGLKELLRAEADKQLEIMDYASGEYRDHARYVWENQWEFDVYESVYNQMLLDGIVDKGEQSREQLRRILKMLDSPYFARIDFLSEGDMEPMKVYIGKFPFWDGRGDYQVFDWRAPVSGMYYEFEDGPAFYDAPAGRIKGEITCKRQYRISKGQLEYALESSINIDDEILRQELARTSDHRMKDIVATIQKEQNRLIRNESAEVLIIQGAAGSGKTSIALHRAAYFLYRFKNEITAENFLIISPNGIFVDYISGVLPELGEASIRSIGMEEIAVSFLGKELKFEPLSHQVERFLTIPEEGWLTRSAFKAAPEFLSLLNEYLEHCDRCNFQSADYFFEGGYVKETFIRKCYEGRKNLPVKQRLREMAEAVREEIRAQNRMRAQGAALGDILVWMEGRFRDYDAMALYRNFYWHIGKPEMFYYEEGKMLEAADIFPLIYVKLYLEGRAADENIQYLLIDEMQDHAPVQYAVLNRLYPCRKTILGDFAQNVSPFGGSSLDFLREMYPSAQVMEIRKSYRSTWEIMEFARHVGGRHIQIEPVQRHGEAPAVVGFENRQKMKEKVLELTARICEEQSFGHTGILCKSKAQAEELFHWLAVKMKKEVDGLHRLQGEQKVQKEQIPAERLHLLDTDSQEFYEGVMVMGVAISKGLEFDQVIIVDADDDNYNTEYERGLLYVACTRAMHSLTILYSGNPSRFI